MATRQQHAPAGSGAPASSRAARGPTWRALLEAQWRARLEVVTELSLAYHDAAAVTAPAAAARRPAEANLRQLLRRAVAGMTREQLLARPIPGRWSTQEVVCHLADYEPIYADRMKRVIALKEPELLQGDPGLFAARLAYDHRDMEEELAIIELTRKQMAHILWGLTPADFRRAGTHSRDGSLTLEDLLRRVTGHIPHHVQFIEEKRRALA